MEPGASLQTLDREECMRLLASVKIGRMGVSIDALPAVLPVNFLVLRDTVILRTVPGTKLDAAAARKVVAFEADGFDPGGAWGWSVLVQGVASEVTDEAELEELRALPLRAWALGEDAALRYVRIEPHLVSGRRFGQLGLTA